MENIVGIDPGLTGAVVVLNKEDGKIISENKIPIRITGQKKHVIKKGKRAGNIYHTDIKKIDFTLLMDMFEKLDGSLFVIERQTAMPAMDTGSIIKNMQNFGMLVGIIYGLGQEHVLVQPHIWKKHFGITLQKSDQNYDERKKILKQKSIDKYLEYNPEYKDKKLDHNICEAFLIAEYGREIVTQDNS